MTRTHNLLVHSKKKNLQPLGCENDHLDRLLTTERNYIMNAIIVQGFEIKKSSMINTSTFFI